jgi:ADP-ribose pyrophosphatase
MPNGERLSGETVYDGRIFRVHRDRVRMPNGNEATLEVVRHPGSVVLLPMPDEGNVMLVRQYRYPVDRMMWELAAGTLKPGEDPEAGAIRECEEETGWLPGNAELLASLYPTPGYCDEVMHVFKLTRLARRVEGEAAMRDEDEDLEVRAFTLDELRQMARRGEIEDLKTVAAIHLL